MTWAIRAGWRFGPIEVARETEKMVFFIERWSGGKRETRQAKSSFLDWRGDEDTARAIAAKLTSASAEHDRRRKAAGDWYKARKAEILASAGETQRAETENTGSVEDEHATAEGGDARKPIA